MRSGLALLVAMLLAACTPLGLPVTPSAVVVTPTPVATTSATPSPTPSASTSSSPNPTPTPDLRTMELEVDSCNGGTVLRWTPSRHPDFHHYIGLRSPENDIADQYPPIAPAVDWGDLYVTDRFVISGHDATVVPSDTEWHYKVVAYDEDGRPVSRSNVASGRILEYGDLGELQGEPLEDGAVRLTWDAFDGDATCFSAYRVMHGTGGLAGTLLSAISDVTVTELETTSLHPGITYTLRVQAVRTTTLGQFVIAESDPLTLTLP